MQQALFYLLACLAVAVMGWGIYRRARIWKQGRADDKSLEWAPRIKALVEQVVGQVKVRRRRFAGAMHGALSLGFVVLFVGTCIVAIEHWGSYLFGPHWLYKGAFYLACKVCLDTAGVLLIVGVLMALARRYFARPASVGNARIDGVLLGLLLLAGLTGFALEGARLALTHPPVSITQFEPIGSLFAITEAGEGAGMYAAIWWVHAAIVLTVIGLIPYGRWLHLFTIPATVARQPDRAMGVLSSVSMEEFERTERVGYSAPSDLTQWELMSLDACMECGRCEDACPANAVGKQLNPKNIVLDLRQMARMNSADSPWTTNVISDESLWACTNCHACVRECPASIRHVDLIDNIRRFRAAEGRLTGSGAKMLRQLGSRENPWGLAGSQRLDWAAGLDVRAASKDDGAEALLWVGCAGAFDPRTQKITQALARLLQEARVKFSVLGPRERCTGDPARRMGDDFLYQDLARKNIETLDAVGAKTVIAQCPHCFHTIKNEYPQLGGVYEVMHHTQYLQKLVSDGRLKLPADFADSVTYHDPCFLARVNSETEAPRSLLRGTLQLPIAEPARRESRTFCCGAGGGRMWMEESPAQRPGVNRAAELIGTGAKVVATGCPFCKIMIGDSVALVGGESAPPVMDIAEIMAQSLRPLGSQECASDA
jgi:Fe-S oxidoreductase/nitrate reductase gamma subunit